MRKELLDLLADPLSLDSLEVHVFETRDDRGGLVAEENDVVDALLISRDRERAYAVCGGVPIMISGECPAPFLRRYDNQIKKLSVNMKATAGEDWSFSGEWAYHETSKQTKTWGWSVDERVQQFFLECGIEPTEIKGKVILDAGCGNGQLTEALSSYGATVVGVDYSNSVMAAEESRRSRDVLFVKGDLLSPPFKPGTFDVIISNGVIHHTVSTYSAFQRLAALCKPGGRLYLWLYKRPEHFFRRYVFFPTIDLIRLFVSRLRPRQQSVAVSAYAAAERFAKHALGLQDGFSWDERVVNAFDSITPRWRHYHTPLEVAAWFFDNGYADPTITHWDNHLGFGMVGVKRPQSDTPGKQFGKGLDVKRSWR